MDSTPDDGEERLLTISTCQENAHNGCAQLQWPKSLSVAAQDALKAATSQPSLSPPRLFTPAGQRLAALNSELARLGKLPANSPYAQHRIAICRKAIELLQKPRGAAEADELEKLLASLSL